MELGEPTLYGAVRLKRKHSARLALDLKFPTKHYTGVHDLIQIIKKKNKKIHNFFAVCSVSMHK